MIQRGSHRLLAGSIVLAGALAASCAPLPGPASAGPRAATLVLMGTTDTHGWLLPHNYYTGLETDNALARLVPTIDSIRAAHPGRTALFDSGDLLQGNPLNFVYSSLEPGERHPVITAMNLVGYDAAAIGNHEFNYGIEHLNTAISQAEFPFLSANTFHAGTDRHAYPASAIIERTVGGHPVRIGVTGVTPPGVLLWDRENVSGRLDFRDIVQSVRPVVADLRRRGVDLVVIASHGGLEGSSYDTVATGVPVENAMAAVVREIPGIDVVFLGHTHSEIADTTIAGTLFVQGRNWGASLAVAELDLVRDPGGSWQVAAKRGSVHRPAPDARAPRLEAALTEAHARTVAYVSRTVGTSTAEWSSRTARVEDTPILDLINEVQRRATGADLSGTAAFSVQSRLPQGPVTVADVAGLYIYDNTLKAVRISGQQLREYLEKSAEYYLPCPDARCERVTNPSVPGYNFDVVSGVDYTLDLTRPVGQRVVRLEREGRAVAPADSFTLALNNYRASGAGGFNMLADAPVVYDREQGIRELLIEEIQRRGTISPEDFFVRNWEIVPGSLREQALREQAPGRDPGREASGGSAAGAAAPPKRLRVLGTNDFHGALLATRPGFAQGREVGGGAALAAYFERARAEVDAPTVLVDGGDVMQGTPISNLSEGRATVAYYNEVGYDAAALGNHEFDWGIETLKERVAEAEFAWLGANVYVAGTDTLPSWVRATDLRTYPGCAAGPPVCDSVRVGFIGIATESTPEHSKPTNVAGLDFGSEAEAIDRWVPRLRAHGADFVVVTAHSGAFCDRDDPSRGCAGEIVEVAKRLRHRPDLIVSGHTHSHVNTVVNGVRIVQASSSGQRFSIVDLERVSPDSVAVVVRDQPTTYVDQVTPDERVAALVARYEAEVGPRVNEVITMLDEPLTRSVGDVRAGEYPLGNLIADAQRAATGTQVSLMNNGGIRTELAAGPVRYSDLFRLQPFANTLVTMTLTGEQLTGVLEHVIGRRGVVDAHVSGMRVWFDPEAEPGSRVSRVELEGGERVVPGGRYSVTVNDFMAEGGSGFEILTRGADVVHTGTVDLDAMIDHLRQRPQPLRAPTEQRFIPTR
jgi:2',3'-cyclic-nucleotide 2'-phosphodiesterase / 3'-nucleotidase / 5'-nucleotidase